MATQEHSYKGYPIIYRVSILGQDISDSVTGIDNIQSSLDYPNINEFRIAEATITLRDPDNDFNPYKTGPDDDDKNFYERNGTTDLTMIDPAISSSGYRAPVTITAGFEVNGELQTEVIYNGQILNVTKDAKTKNVTILCSDQSQRIRDQNVTNFGIQRKMKVESTGGNLHGNYPFYSGLNEPSLESVEGTSGNATPGINPPDNILQRKNTLRTEGALDAKNFRELATGIETEGGQADNPVLLQFKSPYRNRTVKSITEKLLDKYGISLRNIELPIADSGNYFSNLGRPTYETNFTNTDAPSPGIWQWPGTVTDMLTHGNNLYLLISPTGSKIGTIPNPKPRIIKWNLETDDKELVAEISGGGADVLEEAWKFVANSDRTIFYVLGTRPDFEGAKPRELGTTARGGAVFGSYDSSEANSSSPSKVLIHKIANGVRTDYITNSVRNITTPPSTTSLWPQLAMHYHLGFSPTSSTSPNRLPNRAGNIPDSRRNLFLNNQGILYYPFANNTKFGIARTSSENSATRIIEANRDQDGFNLAGFDFWVEGNYAYLAYTHIGNSDSRFRIVRIRI